MVRSLTASAAARQIAMCHQLLLHQVEQLGTKARLGKAVAEQPNRLGIGDSTALGEAEKLQKDSATRKALSTTPSAMRARNC